MFHEGVKPDEEDQGRVASKPMAGRKSARRSRSGAESCAGRIRALESHSSIVFSTMRRVDASEIAAVLPLDLVFVLEQNSVDVRRARSPAEVLDR